MCICAWPKHAFVWSAWCAFCHFWLACARRSLDIELWCRASVIYLLRRCLMYVEEAQCLAVMQIVVMLTVLSLQHNFEQSAACGLNRFLGVEDSALGVAVSNFCILSRAVGGHLVILAVVLAPAGNYLFLFLGLLGQCRLAIRCLKICHKPTHVGKILFCNRLTHEHTNQ